jgi:DNA-binding NtrC family response regulator
VSLSDQDPPTHTRPALDGRLSLVYTHVRLTVTSGPDAGRRLETEKDVIRIGQSQDNDFVIKDPAVSRFHAELQKRQGQFALVDLGSTNGTYAGNLKVKEATLASRTEIIVGDSTILFEPSSTEVVVEPSGVRRLGEMVGDSVAMREIFTVVERVAPTDLATLITGETGTGKEVAARAIHAFSKRRDNSFVTLALGALPPALIESALFGHEQGALPGADATYAGAFERASGGTLFLDELDQLPLELQPRLLRAVERGEIQRLRGDRPVRVDVRVIAASSGDLKALVDKGMFRSDLYYRLAVIRLDLPPLRDRSQDVPRLVETFFQRFGEELVATGAHARKLSVGALAQLQRYEFPGNVRELLNILRRAAVVAKDEEILVSDLPAEVTGARPITRSSETSGSMSLPDSSMPFKDAKAQVLDTFERQYLQDLLIRHKHNISKAAREAGIDRRHLYRLLDKYEIEVKDRGDD